jgi:hypothetical protein
MIAGLHGNISVEEEPNRELSMGSTIAAFASKTIEYRTIPKEPVR